MNLYVEYFAIALAKGVARLGMTDEPYGQAGWTWQWQGTADQRRNGRHKHLSPSCRPSGPWPLLLHFSLLAVSSFEPPR
jgi:hypothetical protein